MESMMIVYPDGWTVYVGVCACVNDEEKKAAVFPVVLPGMSEDDAEEKMNLVNLEAHPESDGWTAHRVLTVYEIEDVVVGGQVTNTLEIIEEILGRPSFGFGRN